MAKGVRFIPKDWDDHSKDFGKAWNSAEGSESDLEPI